MYKIELRDSMGSIISKEFENLDNAYEYYEDIQEKFEYIELRLLNNMEVIDHCYLIGSALPLIWI